MASAKDDLRIIIRLCPSPAVELCGALKRASENLNDTDEMNGNTPKERKKRKTYEERERDLHMANEAKYNRVQQQKASREDRFWKRSHDVSIEQSLAYRSCVVNMALPTGEPDVVVYECSHNGHPPARRSQVMNRPSVTNIRHPTMKRDVEISECSLSGQVSASRSQMLDRSSVTNLSLSTTEPDVQISDRSLDGQASDILQYHTPLRTTVRDYSYRVNWFSFLSSQYTHSDTSHDDDMNIAQVAEEYERMRTAEHWAPVISNSRSSLSAKKERSPFGLPKCQRQNQKKKKEEKVKVKLPRKRKAASIVDRPPLTFNPATFSLFGNTSPVPYTPPEFCSKSENRNGLLNDDMNEEAPNSENPHHNEDSVEPEIYFGDSPFDAIYMSTEEHEESITGLLYFCDGESSELGSEDFT